jgi:YVTN family beta-propeller protein
LGIFDTNCPAKIVRTSLVLCELLVLFPTIHTGIGTAKADSVIATIPVGTAPNEVAFDSANGDLYVTNHNDNTVSVISGQTNRVIGSPISVGSGPVGIVFDPANGNLYVVNDAAFGMSGTVSVISGQTNTVIGNPIPVDRNPWDIAYDSINGNLYVTNFSDNTVSVISGQTNTVVGSPIPVGAGPRGIAFDPANGDLYVANEHHDTVSVISGRANAVVGNPIPVGVNPLAIAFDPANGDLYVTNINSVGTPSSQCNTVCNTVSIISAESNTIVGNPITVGNAPFGVAFDSANGDLYVSNFGDNNLSVISGHTNTIIGSRVGVGNGPSGIAFDPANDNLYVANSHDNTVSVISTSPQPKPPQTTITSAVDGNGAAVLNGGTTVSTSIRVTFSATPGTNPITGFECSLDNSIFSRVLVRLLLLTY